MNKKNIMLAITGCLLMFSNVQAQHITTKKPKGDSISIKQFIENGYILENKIEGDLNNDGLLDQVLVTKEEPGNYGARQVVVLLNQPNGEFTKNIVSDVAIPNQLTDDGFKVFEDYNIEITNGILKIDLTGNPVMGNYFNEYQYINGVLTLTKIGHFSYGAGSQQTLDYDLQKGILTQGVTNTMKKRMPSKKKIFKATQQSPCFCNAEADVILQEVINNTKGLEY